MNTDTHPIQNRSNLRLPTATQTRSLTITSPLHARNDTSTIDFAYLPSIDQEDEPEHFRVPILPTSLDTSSTKTNIIYPTDPEPAVMKPEISSMSADAVFLPMAEMHDGHAMNIDFHAMADRMAANLRAVVQKDVPVEEQASLMKQIWADLVDDVLGGKEKRKKGGGSG